MRLEGSLHLRVGMSINLCSDTNICVPGGDAVYQDESRRVCRHVYKHVYRHAGLGRLPEGDEAPFTMCSSGLSGPFAPAEYNCVWKVYGQVCINTYRHI